MDKKKFRIKTIENNESSSLYFQLKICFFNYLAQDICFKMYADKIQIASNTNSYTNGKYETIISGTFQNFLSNKVKIDLQIIPKSEKQLTVIGTTLTVWGLTPKISEEYNAVETSTKYYLSYIDTEYSEIINILIKGIFERYLSKFGVNIDGDFDIYMRKIIMSAINYFKKKMVVKVLSLQQTVKKDDASDMYEVISVVEN